MIDSPSRHGKTTRYFGSTIALAAESARDSVVGEFFSNSAYMFTRQGTIWFSQSMIRDDADFEFGAAVGVSNGTAIIGAPDAGNHQGGRAYIFQDDRIFADGYQ